MARHRNVRNLKNVDYDDDYDYYGQSYEDDYGVSPGTLEHYTYSRSSGKTQLGCYMPSEEPVVEEYEDVNNYKAPVKEKKITRSKNNTVNAKAKTMCLQTIQNAVGDYYSASAIEDVASQYNFNAEKAIDHLLKSSHAMSQFNDDSNVVTLSRTPPKMIPTVTSALPQRKNRGRRGKLIEVSDCYLFW